MAQAGLPPDQYNAMENPGSAHVKTEAGCFDLRADEVGSIGTVRRAWMTACTDRVTAPFDLPALEFDALGRVVPP